MKKRLWLWTAAASGAAWVAGGSMLYAAQAPTVEELDQKIRVLERKLEIADETATAKAKESPVLTAGKDGFGLSSADKTFTLKVRGFAQADGRFYLSDDEKPVADTFLIRRARVYFEGTVGKNGEYRIAPDFGGGSTVLQDAYAGLTFSPAAKLRAGKFTPPIGLERLQSSAETPFIELGQVSSIAPNRDVGVQLSGDLAGGSLSYALGVFNGVADGGNGDTDVDDGKDLAARLFAHPFKNGDIPALAGLGIGVGASYGDQEGTTNATGLASFRTPGQQSWFGYKTSTSNSADVVLADGNRTRISPQAYYYYGPFGLLGEYILSQQDVKKGDQDETLENDAWQATISYVLTGEDATYKTVNPAQPFDPAAGQWGAWEILGTIGQLNIDDAAFGDYADAKKSAEGISTWGVGVNWYATKNTRFALNYVQSEFDGGAAEGDREEEELLLVRAQVAF